MLGVEGAAKMAAWCQAWEGEWRGGGEGLLGPQGGSQAPARHGPCSLQEEAKAKEEEGVPDEEGWVKVTRRGRRPVLPRTEAASLRVLERERRKRARKELLNFYAWQHRETKMERKAPQGLCPSEHRPMTTLPHFLCPRRPHQPSDRGQGDLTLTLSWRVDWFP